MFSAVIIIIVVLLPVVAGWWIAAHLWRNVRERGLNRWTPTYFTTTADRPRIDWDRDELDVFLAVCDHYEPEWGSPSFEEAFARVELWQREYPRRF